MSSAAISAGSSTITAERTVPPQTSLSSSASASTASTPRWWRRLHSYVFIAVVLVNLVAPGLILAAFLAAFFRLNPSGSIGEWFFMAFLGAGAAQLLLLGIWIALGGLRMLVRICLAPVLTLLVVTIFVVEVSLELKLPAPEEVRQALISAMIFGTTAVWLIHAVLLPLRWLLGWRVDFDPAYHRISEHGALQMGIKHFFGWTIISALPFALARTIVLVLDDPDMANLPVAVVLYSVIGVIAGLVLGGPLVLACLSKKWAWLKITGALLWYAILFLGVAGVAQAWLSPSSGPPRFTIFAGYGMCAASFALTILGNLLFLRLFGLHLFSVKPKKVNTLADLSPRAIPILRQSVVDTPAGEAA